ncbi:MAG: glycoside hydrolase family 38 C-terminal domain-containing protein [Chloroflexota bacterium]
MKTALASPGAGATAPQVTTIHLISHNHWDREWIFTAKYANRWLIPFFTNLLNTLEEQPEYRFVLDGQTLIIEDYLKLLPPDKAAAREQDIRRYVKRGQLLVGPAYLQPDWSLVSGEALVRNLLIGHKMAGRLGEVMKAGWLLDNFGQIGQAPQIFRGFGIEGVFVWRGVEMEPEELKTEFWWEAPDGSHVLGIYLLDSYRNAMVLSLTRHVAAERIMSHTETLQRFAATPNVLLMNGYEQVPRPDDVLPIIAQVNALLGPDKRCRQSTPPEYLAAVKSYPARLPVLKGYLYSGRYAPILKGVYSTRSHLNQQNSDCQRELESWAERFNAVAWTVGFDYPEDRFEWAWKTLLHNHTHDDVCGCCIDPIARDMEDRFAQVGRMAGIMSSESLKAISQALDTLKVKSMASLVVFNPASRRRGEVVGFSLQVPDDLHHFHLLDGHGRVVPYQLVSHIGNKLDLYLWADDVPPLGYCTFYLMPGTKENGAHPAVTASAADHTLENEHLRVKINDNGSLFVFDKVRGAAYEGLAIFEDGGDCGDTYDYSHPEQDTVITSSDSKANITLEAAGPLLARFRVELRLELPQELTADRKARTLDTRLYPIVSYVELAAHAPYVEVRTVLNNVVKDHRLRVLFPTGIESDDSYAGEPFDMARFPLEEKPVSQEAPPGLRGLMLAGRYTAPVNTHPFQHFVGLADARRGLTIFSRGLTEYEVLAEKHTIALTLFRSVGWLARSDLLTRQGDVGPHIFTPEAQGLGRRTFDYAIYPHGADLLEAAPYLEADRHTLKFRAVQTTAHPGRLPDEFSFLSWSDEEPAGALKLTAVKLAEKGDGLIVRFYNTVEQTARGRVKFGIPVEQAWRTNLNEEVEAELPIRGDAINVIAKSKQIVTLYLKVTPRLLIKDFHPYPARVLPPLHSEEPLPEVESPPVLTREEVEAERQRAKTLEAALQAARNEAYVMAEVIDREATRDPATLVELQRVRGRVATLTRQYYESRISSLLNRQLYITNRIESELEEIGEEVNWARIQKRVGEFLVHYYESLLTQFPPS